ncbi:hypothetical protein Cgig2_014297 [Carnegiea gigantea]|uniref:Uncharacterized protein n=1 Tax=Carnegiea gigantea TaxID=171969 RepID=A0A9Q1Q8I8_9CARY|nr:hypothetical protein Cgig2_014297 [Carnegiea gigantea]
MTTPNDARARGASNAYLSGHSSPVRGSSKRDKATRLAMIMATGDGSGGAVSLAHNHPIRNGGAGNRHFLNELKGHDKEQCWEMIQQFGSSVRRPWLLAGDFNGTISLEERNHGGVEMLRRCERFKYWVKNNGFIILGFSGPKFTWVWENNVKHLQMCLIGSGNGQCSLANTVLGASSAAPTLGLLRPLTPSHRYSGIHKSIRWRWRETV